MAPPTANLLLWWFNTTSSSTTTNSSHIAATSSQISLLETIVGRGWVTTGCLHSLVDVEGFLLVLGWFAVVVVPLNAIPQVWKILSTTAGDARRQQQQQRREGNDGDDGDNEESRHNYHRVVLITEESSDEETAAEKAASSLASLSWNSLVLCHLSSALNAANLLVLHYDQINLCKIEGLAKCSPSLLVWYGSLTGYLTSVMICVCYLATLLHVKAWVRRAHVLHIHCPSPETTSRRASSSIISRSMSAPPSPRVYSDDDDYDGQQQQEEKLLMQPLLLVPESSATAAYPTHTPPPPPSTSTAIVTSHKPPPTPLLPSSTSRVSKTHHHHPYVVGPFTLAAREALYGVPPLLASSSSTGKHNQKQQQQQQQQQQRRGWLRWHRRTASSSAAIGTPRNLRRSCSMCFLFTGRACARTQQHIVSPQVKLPIFTDAAASFLVTLALGIVAVLPPLLHERARGTCDAFAARWADVVGLLNTAVVMLQFVPQVLTSLRTRRGAGSLSYSTYGFDCIGGFFLTGVKIWGTRERASTWLPYALMHMAEAAFLVICLRDDLETRARRHQRRREQKKTTKEEDGDDGDDADETTIIVEGSSQLGTSCDGRPYQGSMFVHKRSVSA